MLVLRFMGSNNRTSSTRAEQSITLPEAKTSDTSNDLITLHYHLSFLYIHWKGPTGLIIGSLRINSCEYQARSTAGCFVEYSVAKTLPLVSRASDLLFETSISGPFSFRDANRSCCALFLHSRSSTLTQNDTQGDKKDTRGHKRTRADIK